MGISRETEYVTEGLPGYRNMCEPKGNPAISSIVQKIAHSSFGSELISYIPIRNDKLETVVLLQAKESRVTKSSHFIAHQYAHDKSSMFMVNKK